MQTTSRDTKIRRGCPRFPALAFATAVIVGFCGCTAPESQKEVTEFAVHGYVVELETTLPGHPDEIYDALTGDISGWWDHSVSGNPYRFYIEPRPGGGFLEIFDETGDGVRHAVVTIAQRGKMLRFEGPLGLTGHAVNMVNTYSLSPAGSDSTRLHVSVHAAGEVDEDIAAALRNAWYHFILERFKPYIESGRHRTSAPNQRKEP